jgi:hypothetical protein
MSKLAAVRFAHPRHCVTVIYCDSLSVKKDFTSLLSYTCERVLQVVQVKSPHLPLDIIDRMKAWWMVDGGWWMVDD